IVVNGARRNISPATPPTIIVAPRTDCLKGFMLHWDRADAEPRSMLAHVVCLRHRRRISNLRHYRRNNGMAYPIPFRHNSPHRNVTKRQEWPKLAVCRINRQRRFVRKSSMVSAIQIALAASLILYLGQWRHAQAKRNQLSW